jgi:hypothetical protein
MKVNRKIFLRLTLICFVVAGCNNTDSDQKAIWLYEQNQMLEGDFQFIPQEIKTIGVTTVKDSALFIDQAMVHPIDSLIKENDRALQGLFQLQTIYLKYDMELLRESLSQEITQLEGVERWLGKMKKQRDTYKKMPPEKPLVRKVECRFDYNDPLTGKKVTKDKIYFINATSGHVLSSQDKLPVNTPLPITNR